jgi:hypothetical protein
LVMAQHERFQNISICLSFYGIKQSKIRKATLS